MRSPNKMQYCVVRFNFFFDASSLDMKYYLCLFDIVLFLLCVCKYDGFKSMKTLVRSDFSQAKSNHLIISCVMASFGMMVVYFLGLTEDGWEQ